MPPSLRLAFRSSQLPPLLPTEENPAPLPYVDDQVPISWLNFYDELRKISAEKEEEEADDTDYEPRPFLATGLTTGLASDAPDQDSDVTAFSIARDCKVFEGLKTLDDQKSRLEVVLKALNELGLVIFFNHSESLKSYVILQPQWLMDQICYIIRDFKRHRLRRDRRIQKANLGEWLDLTHRGIVSANLLRELWVGMGAKEVDFLRDLMIKLGLLVILNEDSASRRYLAPNVITTEDDDEEDIFEEEKKVSWSNLGGRYNLV
jgi:hypothetical protein